MASSLPAYPRAIPDLLLRPVHDRLPVIAQGLELLVEHVHALEVSVSALAQEEALRGRPILEVVMGEEAAKVLILLDVVRGGWQDQVAARKRLRYFSSHFVRGVYQRVAAINPGTFREVRRYVKLLRPDLYLDGPNDADWVFRNEIESSRELAFYVDYIKHEDTYEWVTPNQERSLGDLHWHPTDRPARISARLVVAMARTGLLSEGGLALTASQWSHVEITDETTYPEHREHIAAVLLELARAGLCDPSLEQADLDYVAEHWPFPLNTLELEKIPVTSQELCRRREQAEAAFWEQEYGPFD